MYSASPDKELRAFGLKPGPARDQLIVAALALACSACAPNVRPTNGAVPPPAAATPTPLVAALTPAEASEDPALEVTLPPGDLWERIRDGLALPDNPDKRVHGSRRHARPALLRVRGR